MTSLSLNQWVSLDSASLFKIIDHCTFKSDLLNKRPFHRLCSLMRKMGAQSLWIANPDTDAAVNYEIDCLKKHFKSVEITPYKLFFIQEKISNHKPFDIGQLTFLSCSVIINHSTLKRSDSYLLYSVTAIPKKYQKFKKKPKPLMNYYFHSFKNYKFSFFNSDSGETEFTISGVPFFQKNNVTSFCMQSALATILNNKSTKEELILPNHINEIYGIPKGQELEFDKNKTLNVISKQGGYAKELLFNQKDTKEIFRKLHNKFDWPPSSIIYPWMESEFPGFIIFSTRQSNALHVVPIIGHTLNTDSWQPEADIRYKKGIRFHFRPVSAWVDNLIIHDDNFGMYLCYPTSKLSEKKKGNYLTDHVLFVTEDVINFPPDKLEINLISSLRTMFENNKHVTKEKNPWLYRIIHELNAPLVSRTLVANKENYIKNVKKADSEKNRISKEILSLIHKVLPEKFWLTEITLPDLYIANKSTLISIVSELNTGKEIFLRFPKLCYITIDDKYYPFELSTGSHFQIYLKDSDIETFEW